VNKEHISPKEHRETDGLAEEELKEHDAPATDNGSVDAGQTAEDGSTQQAEGAEECRTQLEQELENRLLRLHAEFDNYRKRTARERLEQSTIAQADLVTSLLPVLDNFERALANLPQEGDTAWAEGVQLVHKQLLDVLGQQGLERIDCNQPFDPNVHEAVMRETCGEEVADGTILQELQPGYLFQGRLLRPSMVKVATRS